MECLLHDLDMLADANKAEAAPIESLTLLACLGKTAFLEKLFV